VRLLRGEKPLISLQFDFDNEFIKFKIRIIAKEAVSKAEISSRKAHKEKTLRSQSVEIMNNIFCELSENLAFFA